MESDPDRFTEDSPIQVKLSGDGARFSRTSNFILLSFSFPFLRSDVLYGRGKSDFIYIVHVVYSGTSELWTPQDHTEVSVIRRCPLYREYTR